MNKIIKGFLRKYVPVRLEPQPTLAMNLEVKKIVIEEVVRRELMTRKTGCMITEDDRWMISRLTNEGKLTGEEIVKEVLASPRQPY
jgi:hypothetical protein